ncbi:uncharacterized protein FTOL_08510 [Fusarium torulosum]|uniref:Uncharacterized protein n=1 Tax=Fusarium torulosum TaxID=33205 RepID=A0AAE8MDU9_9HYPO|nr:uncharacterized protein FTOL_08510 [Fusarium torulosum]
MCQNVFAVYAPCAHSVHLGKEKCKDAKSVTSSMMKALTGGYCKTGFEEVIRRLHVVPATYRSLWDPRLMERYWAIKSQNRWFSAIDAETIGYDAFASRDRIEYLPISHGGPPASENTTWELYALEAVVLRLNPVSVSLLIDGTSCKPAGESSVQFHLCMLALKATTKKAYNFGHVE